MRRVTRWARPGTPLQVADGRNGSYLEVVFPQFNTTFYGNSSGTSITSGYGEIFYRWGRGTAQGVGAGARRPVGRPHPTPPGTRCPPAWPHTPPAQRAPPAA
jgi:hypothetical protein